MKGNPTISITAKRVAIRSPTKNKIKIEQGNRKEKRRNKNKIKDRN